MRGINRDVVLRISEQKNEPGWMTDFRLRALEIFSTKKMPDWGPDIRGLDFADLDYYVRPSVVDKRSWADVPVSVKDTFERLGIVAAEQEYLAGLGAQFDSEVVYKNMKDMWARKGVVFLSTEQGLREYPEVFKTYFASVVPAHDNIFAALNSAVWSGGSFVFVPAGVQVDIPLQAYFRMNTDRMGQFERTLIIAEPGSRVQYVEGCSAPVYTAASLHSAVVEVIALVGSYVQYTTIQNWSMSVYNLVTKRAFAYRNAQVDWVDGNFGSAVTMKYPCVVLKEPGAKAHIISVAVAHAGQHHDSGGKVIHLASDTSSTITAKSVSSQGGRSSYRGLVKVASTAQRVKNRVFCDALLLDNESASDTHPRMDVQSSTADVGHEASVSYVDERQLLYGMSRGLTQAQTQALIVLGFIESLTKQLPMEYAVEINRLVHLEMEGSVG